MVNGPRKNPLDFGDMTLRQG